MESNSRPTVIPAGYWARFRRAVCRLFVNIYIPMIVVGVYFCMLMPIFYAMEERDDLYLKSFLYFLVVTWLTIGYGDIAPTEVSPRFHLGFYILFGFWFTIVPLKIIRYELRKFLHGQMISLHLSVPFLRNFRVIRRVVFVIFVIGFIGVSTLLLQWLEGLGWQDSFYLVASSLTTVGYGNVAFTSRRGFAIFWLPASIWFHNLVSIWILRCWFPHMSLDSPEKPLSKSDEEKSLSFPHLLWISALDIKVGMPAVVSIGKDVFGEARGLNYLGRDDITQFLSMQDISAICVSLFMSHLWQTLKRRNMDQLFVFVDPRRLLDPSEDRRKLLADRFEIACEQLVIVPFKKGRKHWVLLVVQPRKRKVYYLDSHKLGTWNSEMRSLVNLALYDARKNKGYSWSYDALFADVLSDAQMGKKIKAKKPLDVRAPLDAILPVIWTQLKCPNRARGVEHGYFILKYLKDISELMINQKKGHVPELVNSILESLHEQFSEKNTWEYTQQQIHKVMEEWADYVQKLIQPN